MNFSPICTRVAIAGLIAVGFASNNRDAVAQPAPLQAVLEAFDSAALSTNYIRKRITPIRYRIDGQVVDPYRVKLAYQTVARIAQATGLETFEVTDPAEVENLQIHFSNVEYLMATNGMKTLCLNTRLVSAAPTRTVAYFRIDITLASNPARDAQPNKFDIGRCVTAGVFRGAGLFGSTVLPSILSNKNPTMVDPTELDWLLLRILYDARMTPGLDRLTALLRAREILLDLYPDAEIDMAIWNDYLDGVVSKLTEAAENGNLSIQHQLSAAYEAGIHVRRDPGKAAYWRARSSVPNTVLASNEIPLTDPRYIPFSFGGASYAGYREFLKEEMPRAFAVSPSGAWGWASGYSNAGERALANCQKHTSAKCVLYAVNNEVVWRPAKNGPYAEEETDWYVVPPPKPKQFKDMHDVTPLRHSVVPVVTTDELKKMLDEGSKPLLLDVLSGENWSLPGSYRLGLGLSDRMEARHIAHLRKIIDGVRETPERQIVIFCRGVSCWESYNAALFLHGLGYRDVYWYRGGIAAWRAAGHPVDWPIQLSL